MSSVFHLLADDLVEGSTWASRVGDLVSNVVTQADVTETTYPIDRAGTALRKSAKGPGAFDVMATFESTDAIALLPQAGEIRSYEMVFLSDDFGGGVGIFSLNEAENQTPFLVNLQAQNPGFFLAVVLGDTELSYDISAFLADGVLAYLSVTIDLTTPGQYTVTAYVNNTQAVNDTDTLGTYDPSDFGALKIQIINTKVIETMFHDAAIDATGAARRSVHVRSLA